MSDFFNNILIGIFNTHSPWSLAAAVLTGVFAGVAVFWLLQHHFSKSKEYVVSMIAGVAVALLWFHLCCTDMDIPEAILATIKAFFVESDYIHIQKNADGFLRVFWTGAYIIAPVLTLSALLSVVREFFHLLALAVRRAFGSSDIYAFSELGEKSITLAEDIYKDAKSKKERIKIYFCDVFHDETENYYELKQRADTLHAVCLRRDISSVNFRTTNKAARHTHYFLIGEDENENINQAADILAKRYQAPTEAKETAGHNDNMYLFTTFEEAYTLLASPERYKGIRVRIKNEVEAFVLHRAYNGFRELLQPENTDNEKKEVNALIVGLGKHGREMLKLLVWMCQIEGYRVNITAFDKNPVTASELRAECPTLLRADYNSHTSPLDTKYHITLYCGNEYAVSSSVFYDTLLGAYRKNPPSYVFVSLGDDKTNIATAEAVNCFFEQHRIDTDNNWSQQTDRIIHRIDTVVYNSALNHSFKDTASADNGASGNIHYIGSIESTYSRAVIVQSALETEALQLHTEVYKCPEDEFWSSHYSYRSSIATIMFAKVWHSVFDLYADDETALLRNHVETLLPFFSDASQKLLKDALDDIDKSDNDDKKQELTRVCFELFAKLVEHRRWNAYMLTEGFIPAVSKAEKSLQFKRHHLIKSFSTREELANESDPKILLDKRPKN